jgi:uncharacterized protein YeaO (DUF488 family)
VSCQERAEPATIKHASIYDVHEQSEADGLRVLVMRYWPRGVRRERVGLWLKDAAPSRELLREYTHGEIDWAEFERRYRAEMNEDRPHVLQRLRDLERAHGTLTLLCHERIPPQQHCHRQTLVELLGR